VEVTVDDVVVVGAAVVDVVVVGGGVVDVVVVGGAVVDVVVVSGMVVVVLPQPAFMTTDLHARRSCPSAILCCATSDAHIAYMRRVSAGQHAARAAAIAASTSGPVQSAARAGADVAMSSSPARAGTAAKVFVMGRIPPSCEMRDHQRRDDASIHRMRDPGVEEAW
jgi:hypothetical protein